MRELKNFVLYVQNSPVKEDVATSSVETTFSRYSVQDMPQYHPAIDYGDVAVVDLVRSIPKPERAR